MQRLRWVVVSLLLMLAVAGLLAYKALAGPTVRPVGATAPAVRYVVLGWNNLGMHCYSPDFSNLAVLPPYNTLVAQVIKLGDKPEIVTSGVIVEYSFPDNTYSAGVPGRSDKTNFWDYVQALFGVSLQPNVGLTGKGLAGTMEPVAGGDYFVAEGIPLTEIRDQDTATMQRYPYQTAQITVRDAADPATILAQLTVVAPVSSEMMCANCHADDGDATTRYAPGVQPTGKVETNILALHDYLNAGNYAQYLADRPDLLAKTPLLDHQPVLCASCHGSNALGTAGVSGIKNLSNAMHGHHNPTNAPDITPDTAGCYSCHPGPNTQCLRDTMSQDEGMTCVDCHGDITRVAKNPSPWLNEPQCGQTGCHGAMYKTNQPLYRESQGHGGVFCAGCHDSPHAIAPSREPNDALKFVQLQGHPGTLNKCTVCHTAQPAGRFQHTLYMKYRLNLPVMAR